jgi:hypothetical protein
MLIPDRATYVIYNRDGGCSTFDKFAHSLLERLFSNPDERKLARAGREPEIEKTS